MTMISRSMIALGVRVALASIAAVAVCPGAANAQQQSQVIRQIQFDIPRQAATTGVLEFARQADVQILASEKVLAAKHTAAVQGSLTLNDGLSALLAGTGLVVASSDGRTITLELGANSPEATSSIETLETVNVFGTLDHELNIGSKGGLSLRETPKSVTVVTRERIDAQNLTSLAEVLNQTTGVTAVGHSPSGVDNYFYSRGFRVQTMQLDGGAPVYSGGFGSFLAPDTAAYDRIEMLRGVDGMYSGAGAPGGVVNLVRKRAKATPQSHVNLSAGSWNAYRGEVDVTGPLTDDGRLRGRLAGAYADKDYYYDRAQSEKTLIFGTAEYDLTPSTLLIAGGSYERRKEDGYTTQGVPRYSDGSDLKLPRSNYFNPEWARWYLTSKEVFARVEQEVGERATVKLNLTRLDQESENRSFLVFGYVNPLTLTGPGAITRAGDFNSVQDLVDLSINGEFELFGLEHRYTVGADYSNVDGGGSKDIALAGYASRPPVNVFDFDPSLFPRPAETVTGIYPDNGQEQQGYYATVGLQLAEPLRLTLGGRYGEFRYLQVYRPVAPDGTVGAPSTIRYDDSKFIPSVALTFDFAQDWSAYASYAETFEVQSSLLHGPLPGTPLDPVTGAGYEVGVKGEVFGVLNTSAAVYYMTRNGQGIRDQSYPPATPGSFGASCCYLGNADVTSKGFDAEVSGTVLPGWQLFAGYTYYTNSYENLNTIPVGNGETLPGGIAYTLNRAPKHMFKMWTTWQLPGAASRWTLNAGVLAQTGNYIDTSVRTAPGATTSVKFRAVQDPYSVWNASVQYRLNDNWTVGLYGDNLFDKRYYQVLGGPWENTYGMPRSFVFTLRANW